MTAQPERLTDREDFRRLIAEMADSLDAHGLHDIAQRWREDYLQEEPPEEQQDQ